MTGLVPTLQVAIGPVILISGVGLLLLTMTNRLARTIDRARSLGRGGGERASSQLAVLVNRAEILRTSILLASASALCAAVLIILLFVASLARLPLSWLISAVFIAGMLALIGSLILFIRDVNLSLAALKLQLSEDRP